jgi:integrase
MSIAKQADGYLVRVQLAGRDVRRVAPTRDLAKALEASLVAQRFTTRTGLPQDQPRVLFADFYAEWWTRFQHGSAGTRKPRPRTLEHVQDLRKRLSPLDNLWLDHITRERLEGLAAGIAGEGKQDRAYKALHLARRVLRDAAERGLRVDERVFRARIGRPQPRELQSLTWEQVMAVHLWLPEHVCRAAPFMALTGLRVGELCALSDADVFLKTGPAEGRGDWPRHSSLRVEDRCAVSEPVGTVGGASYILVRASKTDAGVRKVFLCDQAARLVREQQLARPRQAADVLVASLSSGAGASGRNPGLTVSRLLFPNEDGNPYNRRSFHKVLRRAGDHAGITALRPHDLRSTCASLMRQQGIATEIIGRQLGWSPATLARMIALYSKLYGGEVEVAVRLLDLVVVGRERQEVQA